MVSAWILAIKACQAGHRVAFATAQQWIDRLEQAQHRNALDAELRRLETETPRRDLYGVPRTEHCARECPIRLDAVGPA